jgi:phage shock protein A
MKVSTATKTMNKQLAKIDTSSTVSMLERMKNKVEQEEALAQSYGEIAAEPKSLDDEIDKAIGDDQAGTSQKLQELKQKLGINSNTP